MKALYLALQIILLAIAGFILITGGNYIIGVLILIIAFERFVPLYKEFKGKKIFKKLTKEE